MRILQLCNKVPFPVRDGGTAAMHQLSDYLQRSGNSVKVISINTHKQNFSEKNFTADYTKKFSPETVFIDTRIKPHHVFLNLFSSESYNVKRFDSSALHDKLAGVLQHEKFDCIILESLFVAPYIETIRKYSDANIILRAHNVEHIIWERFAANEKNPVKKRYLSFLASRLKKYELQAIPQVDAIAAISMDDVVFFKKHFKTPVAFIPFGCEIKNEIDFSTLENSKGYFIGAMDWFPNLEAGNWIVKNLLPKLKDELKDFHLCLAGMNMPEEFFNLQNENFTVQGKIENAADFVKQFGILVAPIFSGGGLKIKVVEAMAGGKVIITTPVGAEGLNCINGKHLLIANSVNDFSEAIKKCMLEKTFSQQLAQNGFNLIKNEYQPQHIIQKLENFIFTLN